MRPSSLTRSCLTSVCLLLVSSGIPAYAASFPSLEAFSGAIGGNSTCVTFGPPAPIGSFFGSEGFAVGNIGNGVSDCGLHGGYTDHIGVSPQTSTSNVSTSSGGGPYVGSATGNANYGVVGGVATGTFNGTTQTLAFAESAGFGKFNDTLTYTSPTHAPGTQGTVVYTFTIHGAISITSSTTTASQGLADLGFQQDNAFQGDIFTAQATTGSKGTILGNTSYPGFTTVPGGLSGTGTFPSVAFGFTFGTPVNLQVGLLAEAFPDTASTVTTDFSTTAKLTGIKILDGSGHEVTDFVVQSASGTLYGATGVVPEPRIALLLLTGLGFVGVVRLLRPSAT